MIPARADEDGRRPSPELIAARLVLRELDVSTVPLWCAYLLADGHDGDALAELAGLGAAETHAIHDLLPAVLDELGVNLPHSTVAAAIVVFDHLASGMIQGRFGERWIAQKVTEIVEDSSFDDDVMDLPLGSLYWIESRSQGGWELSDAELRSEVREACRRQLDTDRTRAHSGIG